MHHYKLKKEMIFMMWLDELWLEPTREELDKIELEMGVDYYGRKTNSNS
jgi:hypothetical protein